MKTSEFSPRGEHLMHFPKTGQLTRYRSYFPVLLFSSLEDIGIINRLSSRLNLSPFRQRLMQEVHKLERFVVAIPLEDLPNKLLFSLREFAATGIVNNANRVARGFRNMSRPKTRIVRIVH